MSEQPQTYKNHAAIRRPFHFFIMPVLLVNVLNALRLVWQLPSLSTLFAVVVAAALLTLALMSRIMTLAVQDRVIRLEMRLRLREILPADLRGRIDALTPQQLIALRFASDGELPELAREVLAGNLPKQKDIKMRIKSWQADWLRA